MNCISKKFRYSRYDLLKYCCKRTSFLDSIIIKFHLLTCSYCYVEYEALEIHIDKMLSQLVFDINDAENKYRMSHHIPYLTINYLRGDLTKEDLEKYSSHINECILCHGYKLAWNSILSKRKDD